MCWVILIIYDIPHSFFVYAIFKITCLMKVYIIGVNRGGSLNFLFPYGGGSLNFLFSHGGGSLNFTK